MAYICYFMEISSKFESYFLNWMIKKFLSRKKFFCIFKWSAKRGKGGRTLMTKICWTDPKGFVDAPLFNFEALRCGAYLRVALKRGRRLFQSKGKSPLGDWISRDWLFIVKFIFSFQSPALYEFYWFQCFSISQLLNFCTCLM